MNGYRDVTTILVVMSDACKVLSQGMQALPASPKLALHLASTENRLPPCMQQQPTMIMLAVVGSLCLNAPPAKSCAQGLCCCSLPEPVAACTLRLPGPLAAYTACHLTPSVYLTHRD
jgi:hypothetical protein